MAGGGNIEYDGIQHGRIFNIQRLRLGGNGRILLYL